MRIISKSNQEQSLTNTWDSSRNRPPSLQKRWFPEQTRDQTIFFHFILHNTQQKTTETDNAQEVGVTTTQTTNHNASYFNSSFWLVEASQHLFVATSDWRATTNDSSSTPRALLLLTNIMPRLHIVAQWWARHTPLRISSCARIHKRSRASDSSVLVLHHGTTGFGQGT